MLVRPLAAAGLVSGLCLVAAAVVAGTVTRYQAPTDAGTLPAATVVHPPAAAAARTRPQARRWSAGPAPRTVGVPVRLLIPALDVDAPLVAVGVGRGGALAVPSDPRRAGWWKGGAMPGDAAGSVVIDGHVDTAVSGSGALYHLADLKPGAAVTVLAAAGGIRYSVVARRVYAKDALPSEVFDRSGPPRLVLITCGGPFDLRTRHYRDNVVVFAIPLPQRNPHE